MLKYFKVLFIGTFLTVTGLSLINIDITAEKTDGKSVLKYNENLKAATCKLTTNTFDFEGSSRTTTGNEPFLINGSFDETPIRMDKQETVDQDKVPGWSTTDRQKKIELLRGYGHGQNQVVVMPTAEQNSPCNTFAEINAEDQGKLYQILRTVPGQTYKYVGFHKARAFKTDEDINTMEVKIGETIDTAERIGDIIESGPKKWNRFTGKFTVPEGQTSTYFGFEAIQGALPGQHAKPETIGNYLTGIKFSVIGDLNAEKYITKPSDMKEDEPTIAPVDSTFNYTIKMWNSIAYSLFLDVVIEDEIPEGLELVEGSLKMDGIPVENESTEPNKIKYTVGDLENPGEEIQKYKFTFDVKVTEDAVVDSLITNKATLTTEGKKPGAEDVVIPVESDDALITYTNPIPKMEKSFENTSRDEAGTVIGGDVLEYKVTAFNDKKGSIWKKAYISDPLNKGLEPATDVKAIATIKGKEIEVPASYVADGHKVITEPTVDLEYADKIVLTFKTQVNNEGIGEKIPNSADASGEDPDGNKATPETPGEVTTPEILPGVPETELTKTYRNISREDESEKIYVDDELEYTIKAINKKIGTQWRGVILSDILSDDFEEPTNIKVTAPSGKTATATYDPVTRELKTTPAIDLAGKEELILTFTVKIKASATNKTIENKVMAEGKDPEGNDVETKPGEVTTPEVNSIPPLPEITKTMENLSRKSEEVHVGDELLFTIKAINNEQRAIWHDVILNDKIDGEKMQVLEHSGKIETTNTNKKIESNFAESTDVVSTTPAIDLEKGEVLILTIKVKVLPGAYKGKIKNKATSTGKTPEGDNLEGESNEITSPEILPANPEPNVKKELVSSREDGSIVVGDTFGYKITATNLKKGSVWQKAILSDQVSDLLEVDESSIKVTASNGAKVSHDYDPATKTIKTAGEVNLEYEETLILEFDVKALPGSYEEAIKNIAVGSGTNPDGGEEISTPGENITPPIKPTNPKPSVVKKLTPAREDGTVVVGDKLKYTITATNLEVGSIWNNVILSDEVNGALAIIEGSQKVTINSTASNKEEIKAEIDGQKVFTTPGIDLKNNETLVLEFEVKVLPQGHKENIKNTAIGSGTKPDPKPGEENKEETESNTEETGEVKPTNPEPNVKKELISSREDGSIVVGDTFGYKITATNLKKGSVWQKAILSDQVSDLLEVDESSIKVTASNGAKVSHDYDPVTKTIKTTGEVNLEYEETLILEFDVKALPGSYEEAIKNIAVGSGTNPDGGGEISTPGENTTPPIKPTNPKPSVVKKLTPAREDGTVVVGDKLKYTITATNLEVGSIWNNVILSDEVNGALAIIEGSQKVTINSTASNKEEIKAEIDGQKVFTTPGIDLKNNETLVLEFEVKVLPQGHKENIKNTAIGSGTKPDPKPGEENKEETESNTEETGEVKPTNPEPNVKKELLTKGDITVGSELEYKITATNLKEGSVWKNVTINDKLSEHFGEPTNISATTTDGTILQGEYDIENHEIVTSPAVNLEYNQTLVLTFKVKLLPSADGEKIGNTATANGQSPDGENVNKDTEEIITPEVGPATPQPDVKKEWDNKTTGDKTKVTVGDKLIYQITATNLAEGSLWKDVTLTDELSDMLGEPQNIVVKTTNGKNVKHEFKNHTIKTTPAVDLKYKETLILIFEVEVLAKGDGESIGNKANAAGSNPNGEQADKESEEVTTPTITPTAPEPEITKDWVNKNTNTKDIVTVGDVLTYTMTAKNLKEGSLWKEVVISDELSDMLSKPENIIVKTTNGKILDYDYNNHTIKTAPATDLKYNEELTLKFDVKVLPNGDGQTIGNKASASGTNPEGENENKDSEEVVTPEVKPTNPKPEITKDYENLGEGKTKDKVAVGDKLKYTIIATNKEEGSVWKNVVVKDTLNKYLDIPSNINAVKETKDGNKSDVEYALSDNNKTITTKQVDLKFDEKLILTFETSVLPLADGEMIFNAASATGENPDGSGEVKPEKPGEVTTPEVKPTVPTPDVKKTYKNTSRETDKAFVGDILEYTIVATNLKEGSLWKKVVIKDPLSNLLDVPFDFEAVASNGSKVDVFYDESKHTLITEPGVDLKYKETLTLTFKVKIMPEAVGSEIANGGSANGQNPDGETVEKEIDEIKTPEITPTLPKPAISKEFDNICLESSPNDNLIQKSKTTNCDKTKDKITVGDILHFKIVGINEEPGSLWKSAQLVDKLTSTLGKPVNLKATTSTGAEITLIYDENKHLLITDPGVDLKFEETITMEFDAEVLASAADLPIVNVGEGIGKDSEGNEIDTETGEVTTPTVTPASPLPKVTKKYENITSKNNDFVVDDEIKYTIVATNLKEGSLWKNVTIADELSKHLSAPTSLRATASNGQKVKLEYDSNSHKLYTTPSVDLKYNETLTVTFISKILPTAIGEEIANSAKTTGENPDGETIDLDSEEVVTPEILPTDPEPQVTKEFENISGNNNDIMEGDILKYKITVENVKDGSIWKNVKIVDKLSDDLTSPTGLEVVSPNGSNVQAKYNKNNHEIITTPSIDLKGNEKLILTFNIKVAPTAVGSEIKNIANAIGESKDGTSIKSQGEVSTIKIKATERKLPKTGEETVLLTLIGFIITFSGVCIKRRLKV